MASLTSRTAVSLQEVLDALKAKGISIRVASPKLVMEEAPESYKDVTQVCGAQPTGTQFPGYPMRWAASDKLCMPRLSTLVTLLGSRKRL